MNSQNLSKNVALRRTGSEYLPLKNDSTGISFLNDKLNRASDHKRNTSVNNLTQNNGRNGFHLFNHVSCSNLDKLSNVHGVLFDFESPAKELDLLRSRTNSESVRNNKLEERIQQLSRERTLLAAKNTELSVRLQSIDQIRTGTAYLEQLCPKIQFLIGQANRECAMFQIELEKVVQELQLYQTDERLRYLTSKLRELEKRCALQQLRHEEVLLELEDVKKRFNITESMLPNLLHMDHRGNMECMSLTQYMENCAMRDERALGLDSSETNFGYHSHSTHDTQPIRGRMFSGTSSQSSRTALDPNLVELFQTADETMEANDIPAPTSLKLERQLIHSVLISWRPPESTLHTISAYHVYVDGRFRLSVRARERTRALIDNVDADKPHRISIRAICSKGQSKDAECTLVVGRGMTATPGRLRATHIGTKVAKLSWMPGNSNLWHRVYLNQHELHACPPGVYKVVLRDLTPDTSYTVCVQALPDQSPANLNVPVPNLLATQSGVDITNLAAFIEFRTLPIGMPDPPTNVQLEPGPQDGMLLVTWMPVAQDQDAAVESTVNSDSTLPVQGYTVCLNERSLMEVQGASNDHAIIPLNTIRDCLEKLYSSQGVEEPTAPGVLPKLSNQDSEVPNGKQVLFITVHSTVPVSVMNPAQTADDVVLKGSGGPASLPVSLDAGLLIAAAGSLEAAGKIFGPRMAEKLGINEAEARRVGIPLGKDDLVKPDSDPATRGERDRETGLVTISAADLSGGKCSPTSDAVGLAEALLRERGLLDNERNATSSPEVLHNRDAWPWARAMSRRHLLKQHRQSPLLRPSIPILPHPTNTKHPRCWRQTRSMSDEHTPRRHGTNPLCQPEDLNESFLSSDTDPGQSHSLNSLRSAARNYASRIRVSHLNSSDVHRTDQFPPLLGRSVFRKQRASQHYRQPDEYVFKQHYLDSYDKSSHAVGPNVALFSSPSLPESMHYARRSRPDHQTEYFDHKSLAIRRSRSSSGHTGVRFHEVQTPHLQGPSDIAPMGMETRDRISGTSSFYPEYERVQHDRSNYPDRIESLKDKDRPRLLERETRSMGTHVRTEVRFVLALHTYDPATMSPNPDAVQEELPFKQGQVIRIFGDLDEDGFYLGECNGLRGLVPSNMVSQPELQHHVLQAPPSGHHAKREAYTDRSEWTPRHGRPDKPLTSYSERASPRSLPSAHTVIPPDRTTKHEDEGNPNRTGPHIRTPRLPDSARLPMNGTPDVMGHHLRPSIQHLTTTWNAPVRLPDQPPIKNNLPTEHRQSKQGTRPVRKEMVAIYDYDPSVLSPNADAELELSFRTGDTVIVYGDMDEDGFYSGELSNGRRGLVPSNFLKERSSQPRVGEHGRRQTHYDRDYEPTDDQATPRPRP